MLRSFVCKGRSNSSSVAPKRAFRRSRGTLLNKASKQPYSWSASRTWVLTKSHSGVCTFWSRLEKSMTGSLRVDSDPIFFYSLVDIEDATMCCSVLELLGAFWPIYTIWRMTVNCKIRRGEGRKMLCSLHLGSNILRRLVGGFRFLVNEWTTTYHLKKKKKNFNGKKMIYLFI